MGSGPWSFPNPSPPGDRSGDHCRASPPHVAHPGSPRPSRPKPGADAQEILEEIGLGHQFDGLVERGVIRLDGVAAG